MASKPTHDVVATVGKYTDRDTGQEKKRYQTVGKCFTDEDGRQSIKLDAVPVGPGWTGWLSLYPVKDRDGSPPPRQQQQHTTRSLAAGSEPPADDVDDDIPF